MGHRIVGNRGSFRTRRSMECTLLRLPLTVLALSCLKLPNTDSETSYHTSWRLDPGQGKVMPSVGSYLNLPQPPPINARPPASENQHNPHQHNSRVLHDLETGLKDWKTLGRSIDSTCWTFAKHLSNNSYNLSHSEYSGCDDSPYLKKCTS